MAKDDEDQLDERKSNGEIMLNMVKEPREIIKMIEIRRVEFFGHVIR